jgi:AcrR family transcriptional regulator
MPKNENDRRVQRTRQLLQQALIDLMAEKSYDSITVGDITERANLGRTTFYAHYHSKEDLFLSGHRESVFNLSLGTLSIEHLLADAPPPQIETLFRQAAQNRRLYLTLMRSENAHLILRGMQNFITRDLESKLRTTFDEKQSRIPFTLLAAYLANAYIHMVSWWLDTRSDKSPQDMALSLHRMQRAALRDALGLYD